MDNNEMNQIPQQEPVQEPMQQPQQEPVQEPTVEPAPQLVVKESSYLGLKILLVILILITLGLTGYFIYDKYIAKDEPKTNEVTETNEESKDDTTSNGNNTSSDQTNNNTQTKAETNEEKIKRLFINNFLLTMKDSEAAKTQNLDYELIDYRIDKVEILTGEEKQRVLDMGYKETDILATVTYSVKVPNVNTSAWNAGNGEGYDGQWILRKYNCIMMRDGKLTMIGTSF